MSSTVPKFTHTLCNRRAWSKQVLNTHRHIVPAAHTTQKCPTSAQLQRVSRNWYSTQAETPQPTPTPSSSSSRWRVSTVFAALLSLGVGATAYGLYDLYSTLTIWPPEVRKDLRAAVTAKRQENWNLAERYFRKALETANQLPTATLSPEPYLKLSGISVALAEVCLAQNAPQRAYDTYTEALNRLQESKHKLSGRERVRAVSIALKLGQMAEEYSQPEEEEEKWLTFAVEEVLRIVKGPKPTAVGPIQEDQEKMVIAELELPKWVETTDIGAALEALGAFYSRVGKPEYAMPLYLQAISLLIPPPSQRKRTSPDDMCRGAQLMGNLSDLISRMEATPERLHQAEAWAKQALGILQKMTAETKGENLFCEEALVAAFFNLAALKEMNNEPALARELFESSLTQAQKLKMKEGITEARLAIRRLDRIERATNRADPLAESPEI